MFNLFGTIGSVLRNVFALSFAAIFGLSSMTLDLQQVAALPWASAGGMLLVMGLVGAGLFAGFTALVLHLRDGGKKVRTKDRAEPQAEAPDFDPDRIIASHIARRASMVLPPLTSNSVSRRAMRPSREFGRRVR